MEELILVVDDDPKVTKQARDYLEQGGFRVTTAVDGKGALDAALTYAAHYNESYLIS